MRDYGKAIILLCVIGLIFAAIIGMSFSKRSNQEYSYSDTSTPKELFYTTEKETEYEPSTGVTEQSTEEDITYITTMVEETTERVTIAPTMEETHKTVMAVPGDYIGRFTLTAYEWTGEPMANGEYPYYGVCASNYFPLGTTLYIDGYGTFIVKDMGGSTMGYDVIDIYLGDADVCWEFGVRTADVYYG